MFKLTYKGYTATVEWHKRDELYVGRVEGISDRLSFHSITIATAQAEFQMVIDDYLENIKEIYLEHAELMDALDD